jgi:ESCRT-II complex subunit VPS25
VSWMASEAGGKRAEWVGGEGGGKAVAWIWWRTPEEWATVLADWVGGFPGEIRVGGTG